MKNTVGVNNNSIDSAGITKDYKEAIAELVWNGYDAGASEINIEFSANQIDSIVALTIKDNGTGIALDNLSDTFGAFLDSQKKRSYQRSSYIRGKKGKGRFAFAAFADKAVWHTTYLDKQKGNYLEYDITINKDQKDKYLDENKIVSKKTQTGTTLTLTGLYDVTAYSFLNDDFKNFLCKEYGWFLHLNRGNDYKLLINGKPILYTHIVAESDETKLTIRAEDGSENQFTITYIRWNEKIGDKFFFYYLNDEKKESAKELTSHNNNAINFFHSVFVQSPFFNKFTSNDVEGQQNFFDQNQNSPTFKSLKKHLTTLINDKEKAFVRGDAAEKLIIRYERNGVIPNFRSNKFEQEKRTELVSVVKEIYCIQPKFFEGLNDQQSKASVGFINLLLDTDERERIIEIIESIVQLNSEERSELATLLKKTTLSRIVKTINLIEHRFKVVETLRKMVFDLKNFTNEIDHIQKVIEDNYWLFGEQFHLVSANEGFEKLLKEYLYIIDGEKKPKKLTATDKNRRPDIFICRKRTIPDPVDYESELDENIMVELKRPTVKIAKDQLRQIEDYMDFITNSDQFNSQTRQWKFFVVSNSVDNYVKKQYDEFKDKGKRYLVKAWDKMEIFALTWDDVFRTFEIKHKFLLDELDIDKKVLEEELNAKGLNFGKKSSDILTLSVAETTT